MIVAGGNGKGTNLTQLSSPEGVWVDGYGNVYVADSWNRRVMRWEKEAKQGTVIVGGNGRGEQANQFRHAAGLFFARLGHLYVVDSMSYRVQHFSLCSFSFRFLFICLAFLARTKERGEDGSTNIYPTLNC